jgi:hypothetical protein
MYVNLKVLVLELIVRYVRSYLSHKLGEVSALQLCNIIVGN